METHDHFAKLLGHGRGTDGARTEVLSPLGETREVARLIQAAAHREFDHVLTELRSGVVGAPGVYVVQSGLAAAMAEAMGADAGRLVWEAAAELALRADVAVAGPTPGEEEFGLMVFDALDQALTENMPYSVRAEEIANDGLRRAAADFLNYRTAAERRKLFSAALGEDEWQRTMTRVLAEPERLSERWIREDDRRVTDEALANCSLSPAFVSGLAAADKEARIRPGFDWDAFATLARRVAHRLHVDVFPW